MHKHTALTIERIRQFTDRFQKYIHSGRVVLEVEAAGPVGRISHEDAQKLKYHPVTEPMALEPRWSTFWFRLRGSMPAAWRQQPVDLLFHGETEALLWIDGKPGQGLNYAGGPNFEDGSRIDARLPREVTASGGVFLEVEMACNEQSPSGKPPLFRKAELALFDQEAWDLFHDLLVPARYLASLLMPARPGWPWLGTKVEGNLTAWQGYLVEKMNEICNAGDADDRSSWKKIRPLIEEIQSHGNASYADEMTAIGHAHIDTAWLWPLAETLRKCARTFSTALTYMERYPEYKFACSQAFQYQWMKDFYPSIYEGIKAAVKRGQWIPAGGTWIEPDCNIPSGESLVRQFLYGKRFFRKEFGWDCKEFWNPDVFGYSGALPQIMKLAGIDYFLTQKLSWNSFNKPMHQNFLWRGIDGSEVLTHFPPADCYNAMTYRSIVDDILAHEKGMVDHDRSNEAMLLYGYGDGGGGPTTHMLEVLRRVKDFQGFPRTEQRTSLEFFHRLERRLKSAPVVEGELYLELHRGTYTTHADSKRNNRSSEVLLRGVEMLSAIGHATLGATYPAEEIERLWKVVLLNQFHDILPGSSIHEVYEVSARDYEAVLSEASNLQRKAAGLLATRNPAGASLINTCGWERSGLVELDGDPGALSQKTWRGTFLAPVTVPSCGAAPLSDSKHSPGSVCLKRIENGFVLENDKLRAEFSTAGQLVRLLDLTHRREVIDAQFPANQFVLFDDHPVRSEAWDVEPFHLEKRSPLPPAKEARVLEEGPLRAGLEFVHDFAPSSMTQRVYLDAGSAQVEFECNVHWQHRKRFLKVEFPVLVKSAEAAFEIQFGHIKRPTHLNNSHDLARFEVCGLKWIDLGEAGYGAALFTDSKYGYAVHESVMRISLLRGTEHPDPEADMGDHEFRFAFYPHQGSLEEAGVVRRAYEFNTPWIPIEGTVEKRSWFSVDSPHLIIDTVKKAEDSGGLIVRLYECHGARGEARLKTCLPFRKATLTNLLEEPIQAAPLEMGEIPISFRPFQILTLLVEP